MALSKSKIEILDSIITKAELGDVYCWSVYWLDDDDYDWEDYHDGYDLIDYEYLPEEFQPKSVTYISKRGIRVSKDTWSPGKLIDMTSIYSKEVLRHKRINHILGIEPIRYPITTLGDIFNIKK
jgi:hypothetical protein